MALGMRGSGIRRLFLMEGAFTGLLGGAIGTFFGLIVVGILSVKGLDITAFYGDMDIGYPIAGMIYFPVELSTFIWSWILTGVLAALASFYPAYRSSRQNPVDALRHV